MSEDGDFSCDDYDNDPTFKVDEEDRAQNLICKYFKVSCLNENEKVLALCKTCHKSLKGNSKSNSNFLTHLKKCKPEKFKEYKKLAIKNRDKKNDFSKKILFFIADTMSPLSIVERKSFQNLFKTEKVPTRSTISNLMEGEFVNYVAKVKDFTNKTKYICTTADIWSAGKKSFFGYTAHIINEESMEKESFILSCKRFPSPHTYDKIAKMISNINVRFDIDQSKIVTTVTDNASNFVKAFREFGVSGDGVLLDDVQSEEVKLPKHIRCSSHTLNLIGTTDYINILRKKNMLENHAKTIDKCNDIWNKCNRPKTSEKISEILQNGSFLTPTVTRWNSLYDAIKRVLKFENKLEEICAALGIPSFTSIDIQYLKDYVLIMEPISLAIDFLQSDGIFYGYLLPTLVTIKIKYKKIVLSDSSILKQNVVQELLSSIEHRFSDFFKLNEVCYDAIIASVSHPEIKLKWFNVISETASVNKFKIYEILISAMDKVEVLENVYEGNGTKKCNFLEYGTDIDDNVTTASESELMCYLGDIDTCAVNRSLQKYPRIYEIFLKYNTTITSSAPVERLFSLAGIINSPRRNAMSDDHFEQLVILKSIFKKNSAITF